MIGLTLLAGCSSGAHDTLIASPSTTLPPPPLVRQFSDSWAGATYLVTGSVAGSLGPFSQSVPVHAQAMLSEPASAQPSNPPRLMILLYWPMFTNSDAGVSFTFADVYGERVSRFDVIIPSSDGSKTTFSFVTQPAMKWLALGEGGSDEALADEGRYRMVTRHPRADEWTVAFSPNQHLTGAWAIASSGSAVFDFAGSAPPWQHVHVHFEVSGSNGTLKGDLQFALEQVEMAH